jgi:hypothetical protein
LDFVQVVQLLSDAPKPKNFKDQLALSSLLTKRRPNDAELLVDILLRQVGLEQLLLSWQCVERQ